MSNIQEYYNKQEKIAEAKINNFNNYWYYFAPNWYIITDDNFWEEGNNIKNVQGYIFQKESSIIQVKKENEDDSYYKKIINGTNVYLQNLPFHCGISNSKDYEHIYYDSNNDHDLVDRLDTGDQVYSLKVDLDAQAFEEHFIFTKRPDINGFLYETRWDENGHPYFYFWYDRHILYTRQQKYNLNISLYTNKFFNYQKDTTNGSVIGISFLDIFPNSQTANLKYNEPYGVKFYNNDKEEMIIDHMTYTALVTPPDGDIASSNYQLNFRINSAPSNYTLRIY